MTTCPTGEKSVAWPAKGTTGGLLRKAFLAGQTHEICWTEVTVGDLVITVASDALKVDLGDRRGVRLPVSYADTVAICRELGCVAPTVGIADAMFAQARHKLGFVPLVRTAADSAKMTSIEFSLRFHDAVERQIATAGAEPGALLCGAWKYWLLHPRLAERGAVNYGFWDLSRRPPAPVQTVGGRHDAQHHDYSQLLQPVRRTARRAGTGEEVDLIEYIESHDHVPARFLDAFRPEASDGARSFADPYDDVDLVEVLAGAGVAVEAWPEWRDRGGPDFDPEGIMVHHTAGPRSGDAPSLLVCVEGRPDLRGPLCHVFVARSGRAYVLAAGAAHHAGPGAREVAELVRRDEVVIGDARENGYTDAVPGNRLFYGIEVENSGTAGDPYPPEQIDALVAICAALCQAHGWSASRVIHHRQWTPRKIDMSFRGDLASLVAQKMDAGVVTFGAADDPSEPAWEPEPESESPLP